jgi:hypothetical protein
VKQLTFADPNRGSVPIAKSNWGLLFVDPFLFSPFFSLFSLLLHAFSSLLELRLYIMSFGIVNGGHYYLVPANAPNKVLGCESRGVASGTKLVLWDNDGDANQKWIAQSRGGGLWSFSPAHAAGQRLDSNNGTGHPCHLWDTADPENGNQKWRLEAAPNGHFFVRRSTDGAVLDVANYGTNNGSHVHAWGEVTGATNQQWSFRPVGAPVHGAAYHIIPRNATNKVLGCAGRGVASGTQVVLWDNDNDHNQHWKAQDRGNGAWSFHPEHAPGQRLDGNSGFGNHVHIWDTADAENANQKWILEPTDSEFFILHRAAGGVLDVANFATQNGATLHTWKDVTRAPNQQFAFRRVH